MANHYKPGVSYSLQPHDFTARNSFYPATLGPNMISISFERVVTERVPENQTSNFKS